jgi:hypothetical protein
MGKNLKCSCGSGLNWLGLLAVNRAPGGEILLELTCGECDKSHFARLITEEPAPVQEHRCPACDGREVSLHLVCHNSACERYADEQSLDTTPAVLNAIQSAIVEFANKERGIPQATIAAELVAELEAAISAASNNRSTA